MDFRHEWKHVITFGDLLALRSRLGAVMETDRHAVGGKYVIRSIYFDDLNDSVLREKTDGVNDREKFRLRYYNGDAGWILLEKKSRTGGLCSKERAEVSLEEVNRILKGDLPASDAGTPGEKPLLQELCMKMTCRGLRPKTIVEYTRIPFVYTPGNVRVTLDYRLRTGLCSTDFLDPQSVTVPGTRTAAFSKYAACRIYD